MEWVKMKKTKTDLEIIRDYMRGKGMMGDQMTEKVSRKIHSKWQADMFARMSKEGRCPECGREVDYYRPNYCSFRDCPLVRIKP